VPKREEKRARRLHKAASSSTARDLVLDMQGAVQMALLQSTDYQEQLETLYLSSLDVTFERFRFDTQFFSGSRSFTLGPNRSAL
jgi:hypothetical protein